MKVYVVFESNDYEVGEVTKIFDSLIKAKHYLIAKGYEKALNESHYCGTGNLYDTAMIIRKEVK